MFDLNSLSPLIFIITGFTIGFCFKILWDNKNDLSKSGTSRVKDV